MSKKTQSRAPRAKTAGATTVELVVVCDDLPSHEEIAALAYSYWKARGGQGGSPEEDWLRAERQLRERRSQRKD